MPIYEFRCKKCKTEFSELFSSSSFDLKEVECPKCNAKETEKLLSVFASDTRSPDSFSGMNTPSCGPGCGCHN